jgi:hypothetical protein
VHCSLSTLPYIAASWIRRYLTFAPRTLSVMTPAVSSSANAAWKPCHSRVRAAAPTREADEPQGR